MPGASGAPPGIDVAPMVSDTPVNEPIPALSKPFLRESCKLPPFNKVVSPPPTPIAAVLPIKPAPSAPSPPAGPRKYASAAASAIWPIELLPTSWTAFDIPFSALLKISDMEVLQE